MCSCACVYVYEIETENGGLAHKYQIPKYDTFQFANEMCIADTVCTVFSEFNTIHHYS